MLFLLINNLIIIKLYLSFVFEPFFKIMQYTQQMMETFVN